MKVTDTVPNVVIQCNDSSEAATPAAIMPVTARHPQIRSIAACVTPGNADLDGVVATATTDAGIALPVLVLAGWRPEDRGVGAIGLRQCTALTADLHLHPTPDPTWASIPDHHLGADDRVHARYSSSEPPHSSASEALIAMSPPAALSPHSASGCWTRRHRGARCCCCS
jgi:hypothetical protein